MAPSALAEDRGAHDEEDDGAEGEEGQEGHLQQLAAAIGDEEVEGYDARQEAPGDADDDDARPAGDEAHAERRAAAEQAAADRGGERRADEAQREAGAARGKPVEKLLGRRGEEQQRGGVADAGDAEHRVGQPVVQALVERQRRQQREQRQPEPDLDRHGPLAIAPPSYLNRTVRPWFWQVVAGRPRT